ncbi:hypothetical protein CLAIMM_14266 [Cladophialophora immunda]|nr:hypothetical protein CLAIMM_14266 [Cladophialophora immunda]
MDLSLLTASGNTPCTAPSAPGESIPAWLYRRALFLLDRDWKAGSVGGRYQLRDVLTTQTGIRIPDALMTAIVAQFVNFDTPILLQIRAFPEAEMSPAASDQIQPVSPARQQTATTEVAPVAARELVFGPDTPEHENEVARSEKRDDAGPVEESEFPPIPNDTSRHSPRTLEAPEIPLSVRYQTPGSFSVSPDLRSRETDQVSEHPVSQRQQRLPNDDNDDDPSSSMEQGEDTNAQADDTGIQDDQNDIPEASESEETETSAGDRERLIQSRLRILVEGVRAIEGFDLSDTDDAGEYGRRDANYLADPGDHRVYRTASGQQRRVIRREPPSLPSSPPRADHFPNESQPELDPDMHYWTSADGMKQDMKKFTPDPNPPPPPKRKWEDVIAAARKAQEDAQRGLMPKPKPKAKGIGKGKKAKGVRTTQQANADGSANAQQPSPAKRTATAPRRRAVRAPPALPATTRETRSAAAKRKREEEEASGMDSSGEDSAQRSSKGNAADDSDGASPPPAKRPRLKLILRMPKDANGSH